MAATAQVAIVGLTAPPRRADIDVSSASFADIAVALTLASGKLQLDMTQTRIIAERIGLSEM